MKLVHAVRSGKAVQITPNDESGRYQVPEGTCLRNDGWESKPNDSQLELGMGQRQSYTTHDRELLS